MDFWKSNYKEICLNGVNSLYVKNSIADDFEKHLEDILILGKLNGYDLSYSDGVSVNVQLYKDGKNIVLQFALTTRRIIDVIYFVPTPVELGKKFDYLNGVRKIGLGVYKDACHEGKINLLKEVKKVI